MSKKSSEDGLEYKKSREQFDLRMIEFTGDEDIDATIRTCLEIMKSKGADYTIGSSDRLHNFRTVGEFTGQSMESVWGVYFYKHVSALFAYIKGKTESEPIEGRVQDCIVYLLLFSKMIAEKKRESTSKAPYDGWKDPVYVAKNDKHAKFAAENLRTKMPDIMKVATEAAKRHFDADKREFFLSEEEAGLIEAIRAEAKIR